MQVEELKLRLISGGKSTQQPLSTQNKLTKNQKLLSILSKFNGTLEAKFDTLAEYDDATSILRDNNVSFKTKIVRIKKGPTKYYITLVKPWT